MVITRGSTTITLLSSSIFLLLLINTIAHTLLVRAIVRNNHDYPETKSFTTTGQPNLNNIKATTVLREQQSPPSPSSSRVVKCEFRFSTLDCEDVRAKIKQEQQEEQQLLLGQQQEQQEAPPARNYNKLQLLEKECFTKSDDYWTYKLCVGDDIVQSHGPDQYILGKFLSTHNAEQTYGEGTVCETSQKQHAGKKRTTNVKFMCGKSAGIISISEPEVCVYQAVVTHPALCGEDSAFEVFSGSARDLGTARVAQLPLDYWMLSVEKTSSGEYLCSLKSVLRDWKTKLTTCFSHFSLTMHSVVLDDDGEELERQPLQLRSVVAREENRRPLPKSQMLRVPGGVKENEAKFPGFLEYLHIRGAKTVVRQTEIEQ